METFVLAIWESKNLAFQLQDVKEVIFGDGKGKNIHPLCKSKAARNSHFKVLTNNGYLIPSDIKPSQVQGKKLILDIRSSNILGDRFDFVSISDGRIAISFREL